MKNFKLNFNVFFYFFFVALFIRVTFDCLFAEQPFANLNMIFDDGTVLIYKGSTDGIKVGDVFEVKRGTNTIGKIEVTKVEKLFTYAKEISATEKFKELDMVVKITEKETSSEKREKQKEISTKEKIKEEKLEEPSSDKKIIEEEKSKEIKQKEAKKEVEKKVKETKIQKKEHLNKKTSSQTIFGLSGLIMNSTDEILPLNGAAIYSRYLSNNKLDLGAIAFGFSYGATENVEFSINRFKYFDDDKTTDEAITSFSLKYVPKTNKQLMKNYEIKYNGSFCYLSSSGNSAVKVSLNASSEYLKGKVYGNLYGFLGDLPEKYKGISFSGGYEFNLNENLSLLLEYDHRFLPFSSYRTPSIGIRYNSNNTFSVDLSFIDFTEDKIISAGGSYSF